MSVKFQLILMGVSDADQVMFVHRQNSELINLVVAEGSMSGLS